MTVTLEFPQEGLAQLMPHSTIALVYCDTALAGIRLGLAYHASLSKGRGSSGELSTENQEEVIIHNISDLDSLTGTDEDADDGRALDGMVSLLETMTVSGLPDYSVKVFQAGIKQELITFLLVTDRPSTRNSTLLAQAIFDLLIKYQVRRFYIAAAPNFKALSNGVHVLNLPDLDVQEDGVTKLAYDTDFKDHFLVTLLALLNLETENLTTRCFFYPGKRITKKSTSLDRSDRNMIQSLAHFVNEEIGTFLLNEVLEDVSSTFLETRPNLTSYALEEEVQSALYI